MAKEKLVLDTKALEQMGFKDEAIYIIEYDLPYDRKVLPKTASDEQKKANARLNQLAREFRNALKYMLRFKLNATKHLQSCWIIPEKSLNLAVEQLEQLKQQMEAKGFQNVDKRIRIIPILTTLEGYESFQERKAEFLLDFAMEHIRYAEKGIKQRRMSKSQLWLCKRAIEIIGTLKDELKGNQRYNEVCDTLSILDDDVGRIENIIKEEQAKQAKNED